MSENRQYATKLGEEVLEMSLVQQIGGSGLHEAFARILADRFEEAVTSRAGEFLVNHYD